MGKPDEARKQFDLILSGKNLEANAATRKGKYSLEVCFQKSLGISGTDCYSDL